MEVSAYIKKEARYGLPAADQILFNRHYTVGYSYYFRQAKWALEIIDQDRVVERSDNFRSDYRVPQAFRQDPEDYVNSGYHRGHLVASANQSELEMQNSETFLLSNISPQEAGFNLGIWRRLEEEIRRLDLIPSVLETYVVCGPIFDFSRPTLEIGKNTANGVAIPVPTHFFKSVLAEYSSGRLDVWSFLFPNESSSDPLDKYQQKTSLIERLSGIVLWGALTGDKMEKLKDSVSRLW